MQLMIRTEAEVAGRVVVRVAGELDMTSAPRLRQDLLDAVGTPGVTSVVVDLSGVTFIDSSGIGALIVARTTAERSGVVVVVEHPTAPVLRVLQMVGVAPSLGLPDGSGL